MTNIKKSSPIPFASTLRLRRYELRMSQKDVAEKAGVTRNYVAMIENGAPLNLSLTVLGRVCSALNLKLSVDIQKESEPQK